jgi:hypothetical protein
VDEAAQLDDGPAFAQQLESLGLVLVDIPGDGNCLFRSDPRARTPSLARALHAHAGS